MLKIESLDIGPNDGGLGELVTQTLAEAVSVGRKGPLPSKDIITKMSNGVRDPNRVNIYVDDQFAFSLDVAQVLDLGVKIGQQISPERRKELEDASEFGKLYQRTLEWALTRPHSLREAKDYLRQRQLRRQQNNRQRVRDGKKPWPEITSATAELVIKRLVDRKYLDDQKFAEYFVENRSVRKGSSRKKLQTELRKKGVSENIIEQVLKDSSRNETDELQKMLKKKRAKYDDQKLIAYLVRQGFDYQEVKTAVEQSNATEH